MMGRLGYRHTEEAIRKIREAAKRPRKPRAPLPLKDENVEFDKLWTQVTESGCWIWLGRTLPNGYPLFNVNGKCLYAHRFAFERWKGPIPSGFFVCHSCDVPLCVNPYHLFSGTASDNMRDCWSKGRGFLVGGASGEEHPFASVTWEEVRQIRALYHDGRLIKEPGKCSGRELAAMFKTTYAAVMQIVGGTTWRERSS